MKIQSQQKPFLLIVIGLLILGIFFWRMRHSRVNDAIEELQTDEIYDKIKERWKVNSLELSQNSEWVEAVKKRLSEIPLSSNDSSDISKWFPVKTYVNVVVIPDLSGRLNKDPFPVDNDKVVIKYIWQAFRMSVINSYTANNGENTQDKLIIDLTREREVQLQSLAKQLIFDCAATTQPGVPYLKSVDATFYKSVDEIYTIARVKTQGADYYKYINESLNQRYSSSSPFVKFRNMVIILTDGYLETTSSNSTLYYTGSPNQLKSINAGLKSNKPLNSLLDSQDLPIRRQNSLKSNLKGWEVLILQVRDRDDGDTYILKELWTEWLTGAGATMEDGLSFQTYQTVPENNKSVIAKFFHIDVAKLASPKTKAPPTDGGKSTSESTDYYKQYDETLTEAERAVNENDFNKGRLLLRQAAQFRHTANLPLSEKGKALFQNYVAFADKSFETFMETKTEGLNDIPARYYELALLIQPTDEIQRKLVECK